MTMVSVIIPVYNPRKELFGACIDSIVAQSYDDYEVVIVDDGSNDSAKELIDEQAHRIQNVNVIHKRNEGVSVARNIGVRHARGKYITFVDDDDVIAPYMLQHAVTALENNGLDIIYGYTRIADNMEKTYFRESRDVFLLKDNNKTLFYNHLLGIRENIFIEGQNYIALGPISRVIRKDVVAKVSFEENLTWGEDHIWNIHLFKQLDKIGLCREVWYLYIYNNGSVCHKYRDNAIEEYEKYLHELRCFSISETQKNAYLKRTFCVASELCKFFYFSKDYGKSIFEGSVCFNKLMKTYPWNYAMQLKIAYLSDWKTLAKFFLIKTKLFYWVLLVKSFIKNL